MRREEYTPLGVATRFVGLREVEGHIHNPAIVAMHQLVNSSVRDDETPWCSAFVNYVAWLLSLERSNSLAARSWLGVGRPVEAAAAAPGFCVAVLSRGVGPQPGPSVLNAPGHVGFFAGWDGDDKIRLLGGNQGNAVSLASFPRSRLLGIRELMREKQG